jgi:hypothetical protein
MQEKRQSTDACFELTIGKIFPDIKNFTNQILKYILVLNMNFMC